VAKQSNKPSQAKKPTKTIKETGDTAFSASDEEKIELALKRCTAHLKRLDTSVAREVTRRLPDYYLRNGIKSANPRPFLAALSEKK
jgi:hypothetical protein